MIWTVQERREVDRSDVALCRFMHWSYADLMALPVRVYDELVTWVSETATTSGE